MSPTFATLFASLAVLSGAPAPDVPPTVPSPTAADDAKAAVEQPGPTLEERVAALEAGQVQAPPAQDAWKVYWKDGVRFESPDKEFKLHLGGRIHNDWGWFRGDDAYDLEDGTEIRRARLSAEGLVYGNVEFKAQYDFAGGDADFRDVYIGLTETPVGGVRVGQQFEPFGLEVLTSTNQTTFIERGLTEVLSPGRNTGLLVHDHSGDALNWGIGVFRPSNEYGNSEGSGEYSWTARIAGRPIYEDGGKRLLHLGLDLSLMSDDDGIIEYEARPEDHLVPPIASSTAIAADGAQVGGLEAAWVGGPLSFQSELVLTRVDDDAGEDPQYHAWYAYVSYFLTGEYRPYSTSKGSFLPVTPDENFGEDGSGAWEVALRYSTIDFDDGPSSDELADVTLGLNWYLNRNTRVMLNYVHSSFENDTEDADADLLGVRFSIFF